VRELAGWGCMLRQIGDATLKPDGFAFFLRELAELGYSHSFSAAATNLRASFFRMKLIACTSRYDNCRAV
jgi:hypothetical protein